jgi:hypothetical protein
VSNTILLSVSFDSVCVWDISKEVPLRGRLLKPMAYELCSATMSGKNITAFDHKGGIYYLQIDNVVD